METLSSICVQRLDTATTDAIKRLVRNSPNQYLVGSLSRFNNAKKAEEAARVKHGV